MKKKIITLLLLCTLVSIVTIAEASAYTAYSYGTDYGDGINTRAAAQDTRNELASMGYNPANYIEDPHSDSAYSNMVNAQVWIFNGHGNSGNVKFKYGGPLGLYITASAPGLYSISGYSGGQLNDMVLAAYVACYTGNTDPSWGNLLDESVYRGVDASLGFTTTIDTRSDYWEKRFAYWLDEQYNIHDAANQAAQDTFFNQLGYGGTNNFRIMGTPYINIDPARAGN